MRRASNIKCNYSRYKKFVVISVEGAGWLDSNISLQFCFYLNYRCCCKNRWYELRPLHSFQARFEHVTLSLVKIYLCSECYLLCFLGIKLRTFLCNFFHIILCSNPNKLKEDGL